jgi:hypothetical protein
VEKEVNQTGKELIVAYQKKLEGIDNTVGSSLNFSTADLVSGVLSRMKTTAIDYSPSGKMRSQQESSVDSIHKDEVEKYTVDVIKMKQVKKTIQDGVDKVKTGEERVVVGTHEEKVGTKKVKKPRKGLFGGIKDKIFGVQYEDVDEYQTFEDVEYRDVYKYVPHMKDVFEEIPTVEQETRTKTRYVVEVAELQMELLTPINKQLDQDVKELISAASVCIDDLKAQFLKSFDELDELIKNKYTELESYIEQEDAMQKRKDDCECMLEFIQDNLQELHDALDV